MLYGRSLQPLSFSTIVMTNNESLEIINILNSSENRIIPNLGDFHWKSLEAGDINGDGFDEIILIGDKFCQLCNHTVSIL